MLPFVKLAQRSSIMLTLRGRPRAISNAILPMRLEARSVIRRTALASFPCSVYCSVSCLIYCAEYYLSSLESGWKPTRHSVFSLTTTRSTAGGDLGFADTCLVDDDEFDRHVQNRNTNGENWSDVGIKIKYFTKCHDRRRVSGHFPRRRAENRADYNHG